MKEMQIFNNVIIGIINYDYYMLIKIIKLFAY